MPFGARSIRGFCINDHGEFRDLFTELLRQEAELFRELDGIQSQAMECVRSGVFGDLDGLLRHQREVLHTLEERRHELQPMMERWQGFSAEEREALRAGPVGELLDAMESAAAEIQKRHREQFEAPAETGGDTGDIAARVSRYRAGW